MTSNNGNNSEFYLQWHITDKCNLRCSHCYQEDYTDALDMSLEDLKVLANKIFRTLSQWNKKADFSITGGEPFVRKDLFHLLEFLNSSEEVYGLDILSNGTLITDEIADMLKTFAKLRWVQISLDGASPETHDRIRGRGSFKKAMRGMQILNRHGIDVRIMFTLQRLNMNDIPSQIDLAREEGVSGITIERCVPMGSAKSMNGALLSPEEIRDTFQYISDRSDLEYEKGSPVRVLKYRPLWINIDPCRAKAETNTVPHRELGASCSIGLDGVCILPDATVLACRRLPIPIGNLRSDSLEKIWFRSDLLWQIRDKNNLKGKCNSCEFIPRCGGCRAMAYACTGDHLAEDSQCWKLGEERKGGAK